MKLTASIFSLGITSFLFTPTLLAETTHSLGLEVGTSFRAFGSGGYDEHIGLLSYRYHYGMFFAATNLGYMAIVRNAFLFGEQLGVQYSGLSIAAGLAGINKTNDYLGTHWQFLLSGRWTFMVIPIFISWVHVSNGSEIFGSPLPNVGENFFTVGYVYTW